MVKTLNCPVPVQVQEALRTGNKGDTFGINNYSLIVQIVVSLVQQPQLHIVVEGLEICNTPLTFM